MHSVPEPCVDVPGRSSAGDIIKLKKPHPCGAYTWEVLRIGQDFRLKCTGCGHQVMMRRTLAEKNLRGLSRAEEE